MRRFPTPSDEADATSTRREDDFAPPPPRPPGDAPAGKARPPALPCANCGTPLTGPYCAECGQHVQDYHRSVWRFIGDFLDNTFCWDNKFLRTVQPLLAQPGLLTREFMLGRRVRYVHPLRLFLFTSAVCLALIGFIHHHHHPGKRAPKVRINQPAATAHAAPGESPAVQPMPEPDDEDKDEDEDTAVRQNARQAAAKAAATLPPAAPTIGPTASASPSAAAGGSLATQIQQVLAESAARNKRPDAAPPVATAPSPGGSPAALPSAAPSPGDPGENDLGEQIKRLVNAHGPAEAKAQAEIGEKIGKIVQEKVVSGEMDRMVNSITQGVEQRLSWVALALLPVFALFVRAVYWRRDSYYFEHLVFSLHYHSFLFVFWAAYVVLGVVTPSLPMRWLWGTLSVFSLLVPAWYLYLALRRMYGESQRRTVAKVLIITSLHVLAILIGVSIVGAVAFFSAQG